MLTRKQLVEMAHNCIKDALAQATKAPVRRGYSRLAGVSIPSKADIMRACTANLKNINMVCETLGYAPVWTDPDEADIELGTVN